jgi:hypothetical protein
VYLVGFLFIVVIADARNHEPEICHKIVGVGINFVFIYIPLSVGVWWRVGNTKILKLKNMQIILHI